MVLPDTGFKMLNSSESSLMYFVFYDTPNVFNKLQVWTASRSVQHQESSPITPYCPNRRSMDSTLSC